MKGQAAVLIGQSIPFIVMIAVFYLLILRPQQKKQKSHAEMLRQLKKGDRVVTIGGICGTIVDFKEKTIVLEIGEKAKVEILKGAVDKLMEK